MEYVDCRLLASCLALPTYLVLTALYPASNSLIVSVSCRSLTAACPQCQQPSQRSHGNYQRTVADVPCGGRQIILRLQVRKFVCSTPACPQQIFTERLPDLVDSYARMTTRLTALLEAIGLVAGGEQGARLAQRCGIQTSPSTLLRRLMHLAAPPLPPVRALGVDDWSWKKGQRYGTILVDLERHKIIDLLPDRASATFATWLRQHPEIKVISRDRGTDYAAAAREAAPQAIQIADRFHLVRNLADGLEQLLARCRTEIRRAVQGILPEEQSVPASSLPPLPSPEAWHLPPSSGNERAYQARCREREDRYRQIAALRAHGMTQAAIAKRMGVSIYQVRTWLRQGAAPMHRRPQGHRSLFDPYAAYVLSRWQAGVHDGKQIYEEIQARGFRGSLRLVWAFLQPLREKRCEPTQVVAPSPVEQLSARESVWLFIRAPDRLTSEEQKLLTLIRSASETAEATYGLVQQFLRMVRELRGEGLDVWILAVQASQIPELQHFVSGILKDKEAVVAGLTQPYSNGPVEAQVQKLKLVKRQMFGRAKLPLLRQRLLNSF